MQPQFGFCVEVAVLSGHAGTFRIDCRNHRPVHVGNGSSACTRTTNSLLSTCCCAVCCHTGFSLERIFRCTCYDTHLRNNYLPDGQNQFGGVDSYRSSPLECILDTHGFLICIEHRFACEQKFFISTLIEEKESPTLQEKLGHSKV